MARRTFPFAVALVLLTVACTGTTSTNIAATAEPLNRLVILDGDGSVATIRPDGTGVEIITTGGEGNAFYAQPLWSPTSDRVAWGQVTADGFALGLTNDTGEVSSVPMPSNPFYMYWSPDGRWIGALHNAQTGGIDLEMVDTENQTTSIVATGAPFYFSWDLDLSQVVAHIEEQRFELIGVDGEVTDLGDTDPAYQAPQWTESGVFHLLGSDLIRFVPGGKEEQVASVLGPTTFVANHRGDLVAMQSISGGGGIEVGLQAMPTTPSGTLVVLHVETGEVERVSNDPSLGYFWSPDGEKLLVFELGDGDGTLDLRVWSEGQTTDLLSYTPHPSFLARLLPFFTQYAQSIQVWSPDSSAVALAGTIDDQEGIWVQPVPAGEPSHVSAGSWVVWSTR